MIRPIQSPQNENFKIWKLLSTSKGIRKHQCFFLMGEKLINEFLKKPNFEIMGEVIGPDHRMLLEGKAFDQVPKYRMSQEMFDEIDVVGTHFNLLLLKEPEISTVELSAPKNLQLILPLGDPTNLGAAVRSACAFGVEKIFLTEEASHPFHPKAVKASAGACLKMSFAKISGGLKAALDRIPSDSSFVLDQKGQDISKFKWPQDLFLLVGEEGPGLPAHKLPVLSLPTQKVESLNAAVTVSIACYSFQNYNITVNRSSRPRC